MSAYTCPTCGGTGMVAHPLWGSIYCPEPWAECPTCGGDDYGPRGCDWCGTRHGAHRVDPVGNRNPEDAEDCPECVAATPQACDDCGRSSEVTDPDPERDGKWLCARCHADRAREVAESC